MNNAILILFSNNFTVILKLSTDVMTHKLMIYNNNAYLSNYILVYTHKKVNIQSEENPTFDLYGRFMYISTM